MINDNETRNPKQNGINKEIISCITNEISIKERLCLYYRSSGFIFCYQQLHVNAFNDQGDNKPEGNIRFKGYDS